MTSKINKVFNALAGGRELTAAQIRNRIGLSSPYHAVRKLRQEGYAIYSNRQPTGRVKYRLGTGSYYTRFARYRDHGLGKLAIKSLYSKNT